MSYATFPGDSVMDRLVRGEPWGYRFSTNPAFDFSGSEVEVHLDSPDGVRTTITEFSGVGTGTFEGDGVTHEAGEEAVWANLTGETTAAFDDGAVYKVTLVVGGEVWAVFDLPVVTPPGGTV